MRYTTGYGQSEGPFTIQMPEMGTYGTEEEAEAALQMIVDNVPTNAILERAEVGQKGSLGWIAIVVYRYQSFRAYVPAKMTSYIEQSDRFEPMGSATMGTNAGVEQDAETGLDREAETGLTDRGEPREEEAKGISPWLIGGIAVGGLALVGAAVVVISKRRKAA